MTVLYPGRSGLGAKNLNPSAATIRRMLLSTGGPEQSDNGGLNLEEIIPACPVWKTAGGAFACEDHVKRAVIPDCIHATANETLVFKRTAAGAPDWLDFQLQDTDSDKLLFVGAAIKQVFDHHMTVFCHCISERKGIKWQNRASFFLLFWA